MRVLWFSCTPSLYDPLNIGGWVASLEGIFREKCGGNTLGIAFEHQNTEFKRTDGNVTYYPLHVDNSLLRKVQANIHLNWKWESLHPKCLRVIQDFQPDIIQVFGSEWPFGILAEEIPIPIVVHMQGFLNVYNMSENLALSKVDRLLYAGLSPAAIYRAVSYPRKSKFANQFERRVMRANHYFFGRTEWDKRLAELYSDVYLYIHCPEALRAEFASPKELWKYHPSNTLEIVTISQAGVLKGNELILRTADILKNDFHVDFRWKIAGKPDVFKTFERKTGIRHENVNIELLGFLTARQVADALRGAHVYVHPSIIDNSPNSLCEAQILGCPVIAANVGGIPQLVEDGATGYLYPYNEPHMLAYLLMKLMNNQSVLETLSKNERNAAISRHHPDTIAKILMESYETILRDWNQRRTSV